MSRYGTHSGIENVLFGLFHFLDTEPFFKVETHNVDFYTTRHTKFLLFISFLTRKLPPAGLSGRARRAQVRGQPRGVCRRRHQDLELPVGEGGASYNLRLLYNLR